MGYKQNISQSVVVIRKSDYGLSDAFQTDTSFSCDSYSVGLGGRINLSKALSLDVAYFWTTYSDYTKENPRGLDGAMASMDKDVYSRTKQSVWCKCKTISSILIRTILY